MQAALAEVVERFVGLFESIYLDLSLDWDCRGQPQELLAVRPGVGRDRPQLPLLEQMPLVVEHRDVRQVDAGDRQRAAPVERAARVAADSSGPSLRRPPRLSSSRSPLTTRSRPANTAEPSAR